MRESTVRCLITVSGVLLVAGGFVAVQSQPGTAGQPPAPARVQVLPSVGAVPPEIVGELRDPAAYGRRACSSPMTAGRS